ncbi:hypothetical protein [Rufibacter latericius]|uniref:Uncharacterized protein n=1 Tax=Rufibacter latericius TaxID=2487040 RepID=A0A3M9MTA3_9BACT|nr:hypothetical protein [Rufibacter latericius]RNI28746.1 hypothetical protein EFB08_08940 [Rufibacter latericius]
MAWFDFFIGVLFLIIGITSIYYLHGEKKKEYKDEFGHGVGMYIVSIGMILYGSFEVLKTLYALV